MSNLEHKNVALVVSRYYPELTEIMVEGAVKKYGELGGDEKRLTRFDVPGSFEIPQVAFQLVHSKAYHAVVCLGIIIQGETAHFDYVCRNVSEGIGKVALQTDIPVIFGVLTAINHQQVLDRLGGSKGHKGAEAMEAAMTMLDTLERIRLIKTDYSG